MLPHSLDLDSGGEEDCRKMTLQHRRDLVSPIKEAAACDKDFEIPNHINIDLLENKFDLPLSEAASSLGLSMTKLKKICRKFNIKRWPHRQVRSLENEIEELEMKKRRPNVTCAKIAKLNRRIELLEKKRLIVVKAASFGLEPKERNAIFCANTNKIDKLSFGNVTEVEPKKRPAKPPDDGGGGGSSEPKKKILKVEEDPEPVAITTSTSVGNGLEKKKKPKTTTPVTVMQSCLNDTKHFYQNYNVIQSPVVANSCPSLSVLNPYDPNLDVSPYIKAQHLQNDDNLILDGNRHFYASLEGGAALIHTDSESSSQFPAVRKTFFVVPNSTSCQSVFNSPACSSLPAMSMMMGPRPPEGLIKTEEFSLPQQYREFRQHEIPVEPEAQHLDSLVEKIMDSEALYAPAAESYDDMLFPLGGQECQHQQDPAGSRSNCNSSCLADARGVVPSFQLGFDLKSMF